MDKKTFGIGILSLMAIVLLVGHLLVTPSADAGTTVSNRDYIAITARSQVGGDALYVVDQRTGLVAVFAYDQAARAVVPRAVGPVERAFVTP